jgi:hypothetical protein
LFKLNLQYARSLKPTDIFILSAKYGLVDLEQEIEPYDQTLNTMGVSEIMTWARGVIEQLNLRIDLAEDEVIFLAGEKYRAYLLPYISHYQIPLARMTIGKQLQYLKSVLP